MNSDTKFLETLKKLGFPNVNEFSATDFESYFADPQLRPFLEYFCTLDENNVLTSEELNEYASITPQEMKELEELAASDLECAKEEKEIEKEDLTESLAERLDYLERKYDSLEEQRKILLLHEADILKEKINCEATNKSLRSLFDDYAINKVPQVISQLSATLESISTLICKLKDVSDVVDENMTLPFLNVKEVEEYFKKEEILGSLVMAKLLKDFQFEDEDKTILSIPGTSTQEMTKEIHILKKSLKASKICGSKSVCNKIKADKAALLVEKIKNGYFDEVLEMSPAELSDKFSQATELNEYLKKKEALLLSHLSKAMGEHVDAQCRQVAIANSNEIRLIYKNSLGNLSHPLQYLLNQKARLELLNLLINMHQRHWQDTKDLLDKVFCLVDDEKNSCLFRKLKIEESMKQAKVEETHLDANSVFFSASKVLSDDVENQENSLLTLSDVILGIEKLAERKELISKITVGNTEVIKLLEKQYSDLKKIISNGADFDKFMKAEKEFSRKVNQVESLFEEVSDLVKQSEKEWQKKNELIESKRNLKLARMLYIYAFLDNERFQSTIQNIENAMKHLI